MTTTSFQPRDGAVAGSVPDTTATELATLVSRAEDAATVAASTAPRERATWLYAVAAALEEHGPELAELADRETALGLDRLTGEVARAAGQLRFYADVAVEGSYLDLTVDTASAARPRLVRVNRPLGPIAVFGASNFPFAFGVLGNDTASALAAGCPVVVKAHPAHVLLSVRLAELATDALAAAGAPAGLFALVSGQQVGVDLVRAAGIRAVAFTGSQGGGLALWRIANERPTVIPVYAEMGTVNPVVVTPAAVDRLPELAAGFVGSFTLGSGQFCTKPGLLFAPSGADAASLVGAALAAAQPQPVMLTAAIAGAVVAGVERLCESGAEIVRAIPANGSGWAAPAVVLRAPAKAISADSRLLEECFGPVAIVVEYDDADELVAALGELPGALVASVFPASPADPDGSRIVALLARSVGRVVVDGWPTGVAFTWAQQHGGPWPATSAPATTSVGAAALDRFVRPVTFQDAPDELLPEEARAANPWQLPRRVDGRPGADS